MKTLLILYVGTHPEITETVLRLINQKENWKGIAANTPDKAREAFTNNNCNIVLLGNGVSPEDEQILCEFFEETKPDVPVIQHYGGGSGLLYAEIMEVLPK